MTAAIESTGLGRRYGRQWALRDCTLRIPAGRIAGLVGPNGAGKTTLLHLAIGLLEPSAGSIEVFGISPRRNSKEVLAKVGFVAQDHPLYRGFRVDETLELGRRLNTTWDDDVARSRLARLGIPMSKRCGDLSGGQRAQVALCLALAKRPQLLMLDEPVSSLDPLARREFLQELMTAVADTGCTVLLSSHVLADVERVCDHLVILSNGSVQVASGIEELVSGHRLLVGPRRTGGDAVAGAEVVQATHGERESTLIVRTSGRILDPAWEQHEIGLEDLVLAYLRNTGAGTMPEPELAGAGEPR
ncbi:MAG: ABC transporter ATP-binding protein [Candidatus Dormibacteraeota bacterium]|uniref:ABC transporter ATP-binding protein n=1 Tax=Candidatus Amunia macphersoniae TaxID=3127014 RepID=A0A934KND0_9BACT|nr:ABC transporter ATP-binding protein [Candidatus Dormibacteraeota bacterium]